MPITGGSIKGMSGFDPGLNLAAGFFKKLSERQDEERTLKEKRMSADEARFDEGVKIWREGKRNATDLKTTAQNYAAQMGGANDPLSLNVAKDAVNNGYTLEHAKLNYQAAIQNKKPAGQPIQDQSQQPPQTGPDKGQTAGAIPTAQPPAPTADGSTPPPGGQAAPTQPSAVGTDQPGAPQAGQPPAGGSMPPQNQAKTTAAAPTTSGMTGTAGVSAAPPAAAAGTTSPPVPKEPEAQPYKMSDQDAGFSSFWNNTLMGKPTAGQYAEEFSKRVGASHGLTPEQVAEIQQGNYPSAKKFTDIDYSQLSGNRTKEEYDDSRKALVLLQTPGSSKFITDADKAQLVSKIQKMDTGWREALANAIPSQSELAKATNDATGKTNLMLAQGLLAIANATAANARAENLGANTEKTRVQTDQLKNGTITNDYGALLASKYVDSGGKREPNRADLRSPADWQVYRAALLKEMKDRNLSTADLVARGADVTALTKALGTNTTQAANVSTIAREIDLTGVLINNKLNEMEDKGTTSNFVPVQKFMNWTSSEFVNNPDYAQLHNYILDIQNQHATLESRGNTSTNAKLQRAYEGINNAMSPEALRAAIASYHEASAVIEKSYAETNKNLKGKLKAGPDGGASNSAPAKPQSKAEYDALPNNSKFINPAGELMIKDTVNGNRHADK